jgi:cyclopropane fatty-acyl-phospholipid synthase-like methyltransferase
MSTATKPATDPATHRCERLADRLLNSVAGTFDIFTIYIGDRLGFYDALNENGPMTPSELASHTGTHERYVREWLEQQTVTAILDVDDAEQPPQERRFSLPAGHDEVLVDRESLNYLAPLAQLVAGAVYPLDSLLAAFRTGAGVPFASYGKDLWEGQGRINRAAFLQQLGEEWLASLPDAHQRLQSDPPARVADIGCGVGWSSIGIAQSYPKVNVDGLDLDEPSIEQARRNAEETGVAERVTFSVRDAGDPSLAGRYDLVMAIECIHDVSQPVAVLSSMRRLAKKGGTVLVVDERVGDHFSPAGDDVDWMMYGWSVLHCLPVGMAEQPSEATGTVMRLDTVKQYAQEAGFRDVEVLPIDHLFFRFYRLCQTW